MSTPVRRRAVAALLCVSTLGVGLVGAHASAAPATTATSASVTTSAQTGSTVLTPAVTALSAAEVPNPLRGQYRWMGYASQPSGWPAPDLYYRDQVYWGRLEKTKGVFDFAALDTGVTDAGNVKGKFGFRVMAYCPSCWMESRSDWPKVVPSWMPLQPGTTIPDWNSEVFLSEWENLMRALGARYGTDARLGYVDVGGFGKYGEWMPAGTDITEANALRLIAAVAKAFPTKHVLLSAVPIYTKPAVVQKALAAHPNLGLRSDCLGQSAMQVPTTAFADVWKTRPFFTEWCTGADPVIGRDQVKTYHVSTTSSQNMRLTYDQMTSTQRTAYETAVKTAGYRYAVTRATVATVSPGEQFRVDLTVSNAGSAPTYDPWTVRFVLKDATGKRVATLPLPVDLRKQLPGTTTTTSYLTAPSLAAGTYRAFVEAVDPSGYSAPMRWANGSRESDGSYPLGTIGVGLEAPAASSSWPRDVTSDRAPDVLAIEAKDGTLRVYPTTGTGAWRAPIRLGPGWNGYAKVLTAGTWDGDAVSDLVVQTKAGDLYLRRGNGDGTFAGSVRIGAGWTMHNLVIPTGDFDGDGKADLVARRASNGALYLYRGNGQGGFLSSSVIGSGWGGFSALFSPGDFDGDGAVDVMARTSGGALYLYRGDGRGGWKGRVTIGSGWQIFTALTAVGDFDADGTADVLARTVDGTLYLYRGDGRGSWKGRVKIGSGWQIFSSVLR